MATDTAAEPAGPRIGLRRILLRSAIVATAVAVCGMVIASNLGAMAVQSRNPVLLLQAATFSSTAAAHAAEAEFAARRYGPAIVLARSSLRQSAQVPRALRTFGLAAQQSGDGERAATAMSLAGGVGWRDTPTQLWLIDAYARQGDYASALARVDALLRRRKRTDEMNALAMSAALHAAARTALVERLSQQPHWRGAFFNTAKELPLEQYGAFREFLEDMKRSDAPPQPSEVTGFVSALYERGEHQQAAQVWRQHGPKGAAAAGNALFDGDFTDAKTDAHLRSPFEWYFPQRGGMEISLGAPPGRPGERALHASSAGNARFLAAEQALVLEPGRYTLSLDAAVEPGLKLEGFSWIVDCSGIGSPDINERRENLPDGWTRLDYTFSIRPECKRQWLKLFLHSGQSQPLSLWVDRIILRLAES